MVESSKLRIRDIVDTPFCVASEDGQKVYAKIFEELEQGKHIVLSFADISRLTTAFLNAAIGQLYNEFTEEQVRRSVTVEDVNSYTAELIQKVINRAKEFYKDKERSLETIGKSFSND